MSIPDSTPAPRRVGRAMAWGVAIGVGAVVLRELVRPRDQPARLIDWEGVEEIALARCGEPRDPPADPVTDQTYEQIAGKLAAARRGARSRHRRVGQPGVSGS